VKTAHPTIPPLITRHAADAAFYWQQHDGSAHSPLVGLPQLLEFDRLLDAHLDGLRTAGEPGWDTALAQLQRWQRAPEVFVCAVLALEQADPGKRLAAVWAVVEKNPSRMLRGLISALAWVPAELGLGWCCHWLSDERTPRPLAVAAWRALAIGQRQAGEPALSADKALTSAVTSALASSLASAIAQALPKALASPDVHLRTAACRLLPQWDESQLLPLLQDAEPRVRAEAAMGLVQALHRNTGAGNTGARNAHTGNTRTGNTHMQLTAPQRQDLQSQAASTLWRVTHEACQNLATLSGLPRTQAQQRLMRWLCHLGLVAPMGHAGITQLTELLPPRLALWFVLHHGDGHHLPWVVQRMNDPEVSRLAAERACQVGRYH
jgi:AcrR family transcriptional regulator